MSLFETSFIPAVFGYKVSFHIHWHF